MSIVSVILFITEILSVSCVGIHFEGNNQNISMHCFLTETTNVNEVHIILVKVENKSNKWEAIAVAKDGKVDMPDSNYTVTGGINSTHPTATHLKVSFPVDVISDNDKTVFNCEIVYQDNDFKDHVNSGNGTVYVRCKEHAETKSVVNSNFKICLYDMLEKESTKAEHGECVKDGYRCVKISSVITVGAILGTMVILLAFYSGFLTWKRVKNLRKEPEEQTMKDAQEEPKYLTPIHTTATTPQRDGSEIVYEGIDDYQDLKSRKDRHYYGHLNLQRSEC